MDSNFYIDSIRSSIKIPTLGVAIALDFFVDGVVSFLIKFSYPIYFLS